MFQDVKDYGDFNDNASTKAPSTTKGSSMNSSRMSPPPLVGKKGGGPRCLSRIAETRETSRPGTRTDQHWAITQQFPAQHKVRGWGGVWWGVVGWGKRLTEKQLDRDTETEMGRQPE